MSIAIRTTTLLRFRSVTGHSLHSCCHSLLMNFSVSALGDTDHIRLDFPGEALQYVALYSHGLPSLSLPDARTVNLEHL